MPHLPHGLPISSDPPLRPHVHCLIFRYCESCIKHVHFKLVKKKCPVCRQNLMLGVSFFCVNLVLDKIVKEKFGND